MVARLIKESKRVQQMSVSLKFVLPYKGNTFLPKILMIQWLEVSFLKVPLFKCVFITAA